MSILTRTLFDITTKLDNKIQSNTENKFIIKQPQPLNQKLPYIKEATKNATSHLRSGRLNNSMDVHIDQSSFHPNKEDLHNNSFDMSGRLYGSVTRTSGMNYAKRNMFTKHILLMHKDKDIFSSCKMNDKAIDDELEEKALLKKLQEIRQRKENIVMMLVENERKKQEKEALQEKTKKLMEFSARRIQEKWKKYKERKAFQKLQHQKRVEALHKIDQKVQFLLNKLKLKLNIEKDNLINRIIIIQRNIRKFLALKKLRVLQRRQIFDFIHKKMVQTFERFFMKESFTRIKTESLNKMDDIAFFITCNQGCTITSQSTEFDSPGRSKNSKRFRKTKNKNHYDMQGHRFQKHFVPKKNETLGSPNKSNRSSRSSLKSVDSERKAETLNIKPCKLNFSKKSLGAKIIGDISETANPEDELSSERSAAKEKSRVVYMDSPGRLSIVSSNSKPKFDPEQRLKTALRAKSRDLHSTETGKNK